MKPVFVRELKELSPALVPVLAIAVIAGANFAGPVSAQFDEILAVSCVGGFALGCLHGGLDRWRRGDLFALHRPVPALRMEAARTLAGMLVALLGVVAVAIAHWMSTLAHIGDVRGMPPQFVAHRMAFDHLGGREVLLLAGFVLAAWAVTRFAVGAVRVRWALPALVTAPFVCWSLLARTSVSATICLVAVLAVGFSVGGALCLAGDRR